MRRSDATSTPGKRGLIALSHPDKVFWPDEGYTKRDLAEFYRGIFPLLAPYVKDRLLTLERCPDGMAGECFYQKEAPKGLPEGTPKIAGTEVKWRTGTEAYRKTKSVIPTDLDEKTIKILDETAIAAYQALELRDYGRIDMRLDKQGKIYVLEVNPNPWLHSKAEVALAAKESGKSYPALIDEIVNLALARYTS